MASTFKNHVLVSHVVAFLLLVASSSARNIIKSSKSEIESICSNALDSEFCLKFFESKPEAADVNLHVLTKLTLDLARENAVTTLKEFNSRVDNARDPHTKAVFMTCVERYEHVLTDIDGALMALTKDEANAFNVCARDMKAQANGTVEILHGYGFNVPQIFDEIEHLQKMMNIAFVISAML